MSSKIGDTGYKISCLQVEPGYEFEVVNEFKLKIKQQNITDFIILKGFGTWDVITIHRQSNFESLLTKLGPIKHIVNTTTFFCFPYEISSGNNENYHDNVLEQINKQKFVGLSFVKLNVTDADDSLRDAEIHLSKVLQDNLKISYKILGTLGWNEFIIICSANNMSVILNNMLSINTNPNCNTNDRNCIKKTYTQLTISYNAMPNIENSILHLNTSEIIKEFEGKLGLESISNEIDLTIYVSSEPRYYQKLLGYWLEQKDHFTIKVCYGDHDFAVKPKKTVSWSGLLARLLFFRCRYKNAILATSTQFSYDINEDEWGENGENKLCEINSEKASTDLPFNLGFEVLEKAFGPRTAPTIASHFYRLNSLRQHPLSAECYSALSNYPRYVISRAERYKSEGQSLKNAYHALISSVVLDQGIELRSYGSHGNLQRNYVHFGSIGGGLQRSIHAIEFIVRNVFDSFLHKGSDGQYQGTPWYGFLIVRDPKYSVIDQVLSVPQDALINVHNFWCIYHEIAHMFIEGSNDLLNFNDPEIRNFILANKPEYTIGVKKLVEEIYAEIFGYLLGFYGDLNFFKKLCWKHIISIEPMRAQISDFWHYILRTFSVELFERIYFNENGFSQLEEDSLKDNNFMFKELINHAYAFNEIYKNSENVDQATAANFEFEIETVAAIHSSKMRLFLPILRYIKDRMFRATRKGSNDVRPPKVGLTDSNTLAAYDCIFSNASIYWEPIKYPEAFIYKCMKHVHEEETASLSQQLAIFLTLHNASLTFKQFVGGK